MIRTKILGIGGYVPDRVVDNDELAYLNARHERQPARQIDTDDAWIRPRTGIETRRYVPNDGSVATSDLAVAAAKRALADARIEDAHEIDCIILGTLSPDMHFPGTAVIVQRKLGIASGNCACFDLRQQCSAFVYGLQLADAFVRAGTYRRILLIGAELHSHSLDFSMRGRDVTVLFGDGAGAVVLGPNETDDRASGIVHTDVHADGSGAMDLYLKIFDIKKLPYFDGTELYAQMDGKRVFRAAIAGMVASSRAALAAARMSWSDIDWFVPHQANLRLTETVVELAQVPPDKVLSSIDRFGNTSAASVPLTLDYWRREGKIARGHRIMSTVFGSGFTWGTAIFTV
ncbi:MAG TPA: beta-ketoacyl-ACP synthase 3 [Kofleriaceae bacterium]|jgi:3-oxoacyl-[acyl-carrier-protein] synthase-3|nr:beta-ketoacyl-ACP synthase 3 [Kofleriaceae bacterium]